MSDDGSYDPYADDYEDPTIEIVIETLTGTTFEMTVTPDDKILSIKTKIHGIEGIPVSQQHLLYRMNELKNEDRLSDHNITSGSTLRLVLSMRGGPISTRRLAPSSHSFAWKELKDYVDNTRQDMIDKLPIGSKVTVLLYRDADNINLIRVIENEDGSFYPFSDSWQPPRQALREHCQTRHRERNNENNIMLHKVVELRKKMEGLSMKKQARKPEGAVTASTSREEFDEPSTSTNCRLNTEAALEVIEDDEDDGASARFFGEGDVRIKNVPEVYSERFLLLEKRRNRTGGRNHRAHRLDSTITKPEDIPLPSHNCTSIQTPSIAILEDSDSSLNKKDSKFSPPSPISVASGDANTVTMSQIPSLPGSSRNLLHLAHMPHMMLQEHTERPKTTPDKYDPKAQEFCNVVFNDAAERSHHNTVKLSVKRRQSLDFSDNTNLPRMRFASNSNSRIDSLDHRTQNSEQWSQSFSNTSRAFNNHNSSNLLTSQYASTSKLNSAHLDNVLGNRVDSSNHLKFNNERRVPLYGRRTRIERLRNNIMENANPEKYSYSNLGYIANIEKIQNDAVPITKQSTQQYGRRNSNFVANLEPRNTCDPTSYELRPFRVPRRRCNTDQDNNTNSNKSKPQKTSSTTTNASNNYNQNNNNNNNNQTPSTSSNYTGSSSNTQSLPPIIQKKTSRTRCAFCNKRLNITTIHTCRCGGTFCSQHRYSEVHGCQYDYKTEGRKILEQANPLVAAPKLPKI